MSSPCGITAALPWVAPCCPDCAQRAGATGDTPPATSTAGLSGAGGLLVLGLIFVGVLYGEKLLGKLGG